MRGGFGHQISSQVILAEIMSSEYFAAATEDEEGTELANIHARVDGDRALDVRVPPVLMLIIVPCRQHVSHI